MVLKRSGIYLFIILFFAITPALSDDTINDQLPFTKVDDGNSWCYAEKIFTFRGEIIESIITEFFYICEDNQTITWSIEYPGEILNLNREFYINDIKMNFTEYVSIENDSIHTKQINLQKGLNTIKLKISFKSNEFTFKKLENGSLYDFAHIVNLNNGGENKLAYVFERHKFRFPASNSKNIEVYIRQAVLKDIEKDGYIPVNNPKLSITDKYIDITYDFLIHDEQVQEKSYNFIKIPPDTPLQFHTIFFIKYDTIRIDWIIQAIVSAILLTLAFIGGTQWERKIVKNISNKKPPK